MNNPFVFGKIVTGEKFTNREVELERLINNISAEINTILISPRRWGKSSLMTKAAQRIERMDNKIKFCFIDLFNIRTEEEFYSEFAKQILRISFSKWEELLESAKQFFKQITPKFQIGIDPSADFSVNFMWDEVKKNPQEILNLPEIISQEKKIKIVVCIDEFQNIEFFDNPAAFQKKLRANWQYHKHAGYCLYGSKRHLMTQLFENKSMPFYKFGDVIFLKKIQEDHWVKFIVSNFKTTNKNIDEKIALRIAKDMENHPYFVQQLAYIVWANTVKQCSMKQYRQSLEMLFTQQTILFQRELDRLTNTQINFLKAVCENATRLSSARVLRDYGLGTSANVNRIKNALVKKEILDISPEGIEFLDPVFKLWFCSIYIKRG